MSTNAVETTKPKSEVAIVRRELEGMRDQFEAALPQHIPVERFERVVITALQNEPKLLQCSRRSLWNACIRAAQDGLLPDGRDGAIVPFKGDAQWLPMVFGIRKKVRNSGEILDWDVQLVYENDEFQHEFGDEAFIRHRRAMGPRGGIVGGYSIAHLKDGGVSREIMSIEEIESVRKQASRATSDKSPWNVPAYYGEMCRKTIAKRHSKTLPMSSDLDDLLRKDEELYDIKDRVEEARPRRRVLGAALDALAGSTPSADDVPSDGDQSNPTESEATDAGKEQKANAADAGGSADSASDDKGRAAGKPSDVDKETSGTSGGSSAPANEAQKMEGKTPAETKPEPPKIPTNEREYVVYAKAWIDTSKDGKTAVDGKALALRDRWTCAAEKKVRNSANVSSDVREEIFDHLTAHEEALKKG
jgi:recombination protein RecT